MPELDVERRLWDARERVAEMEQRYDRLTLDVQRLREAVLAEHRRVKFTDADLGIHDLDVCWVCHYRLAEPEDWPEDDDTWPFPLVQQAWPCRTVQALNAKP